MRFGRVLHPEVLLDRRGDKLEREFFRRILKMVSLEGRASVYYDTQDPVEARLNNVLSQDYAFMRFIINCKRFLAQSGTTYHVGADFLQALLKIDRKIPVDILPHEFSAYFSFASKTIQDESQFVQGGYVSIGLGKNLGMHAKYDNTRIINISYLCAPTKEDPMSAVASLTIPLVPQTLGDLAAGVGIHDYLVPESMAELDKRKRNDVFRVLLNCVLYLHSQTPELSKTVPISDSKKSIKDLKKNGEIINACTIPVTFLHPRYKYRPLGYHVGSTWVESHLRWQRCGPGLSDIRLVFVRAHERIYSPPETPTSLEGYSL